ncbi:MAG: phospho-N-acetylmuramoyl-pentapeptide-transferase [Clostridia bacterium]|nr:phospho-N-acetylmuramoyl-pentapeptide-transferase [Clostridia bacterium]MBQ3553600.1 phospho-N-acetylmuramoyl-pentapeptide-transferase [Clostridia bacterium]
MEMILSSVSLSALICLVLTPILIPFLRRLKFGQSIREEGPSWHQKKSGTPTMGGITMIISVVVATLWFGYFPEMQNYEILILLACAVLFGVIGFVDDFIKVVMKRNLGLSAKQKFSAQILVSVVITVLLSYMGYLGGEIIIPFLDFSVDIGLFIIPFVIFVLLAMTNSVNLTDGLDGLAATVTLIVSLFLTVVAFYMNEIAVAVFIGSVSASCLAFLVFNAHPAKVFMGDTGSLFLGGATAIAAIALRLPLILIIIGFVYLMETLSVILQVASFKLTGKRIFKMSPIHHHFEMCGMNEVKIVLLFSGVTLVLCILAYAGISGVLS